MPDELPRPYACSEVISLDRKRLLLIEDDQTIADLLEYNLRDAGYDVLQERDGRSGLIAALSSDVDLAIVDLMLPELDGMSVVREIGRQKPGLPLIILTAVAKRDAMLEGFASGVDDFLTKPFDLEELLARIAARLRRCAAIPQAEGAFERLEGLVLDSDTHELRTATATVALNPKEHDLLAVLLSQPGHLFRREEITHRVWQHRYSSSSRTLDVHVRRVRAKLEDADAPAVIQNVRGVGYRIASITPKDEQ